MNAFTLAGIEVPPGSQVRGLLPLTDRLDRTTVGIPYVITHGSQPGPVLLVDAGTHGDETEGILAVQQLSREVTAGQLSGTLVAVPALNYLAAEGMSRLTPKTLLGEPNSTDLNRSFPGRPDGSTTQRLAHRYGTEVIPRADYLITCHGAGASLMVGHKVLFEDDGTEWGKRNWELARALGWPVLCTEVGYTGTSMDVAKQHGIPCIVPECGGADRLPDGHRAAVRSIVDGLLNVCRHLGMLTGQVRRPERYVHYSGNEHVHAGRDGFLEYEPGFDLGSEVRKGQRVGVLRDVYGDLAQELVSDWDGTITLVRRYPLVRTGDWICSVTRPAGGS
ncbi:MAG: succinylglutamate desuccinylase/aspartoacylase family protein [Natronosporangium sp.]